MNNDDLVEGTETLIVTASGDVSFPQGNQRTMNIHDNPPRVWFESVDSSSAETSHLRVPDYATLKIARSEDHLGKSLDVSFTTGGTASSGDYSIFSGGEQISNSVTIPAGAESVVLEIRPSDDGTIEPDETLEMVLSDGGSQYALGQPSTTQVAINDDDVLIVIASGHSQNGANDDDPNTDPADPAAGSGVYGVKDELLERGIHPDNIFMTSSDGPSHEEALGRVLGTVDAEIVNAGGRVLDLAMIGYSHGGGLIFEAAAALQNEYDPQHYRLFFTGYIDAFSRQGLQFVALEWMPSGTAHHMTYYQSQVDGLEPADLLVGKPTMGADFNFDFDADDNTQTHLTIDDLGSVHEGLAQGLIAQLGW